MNIDKIAWDFDLSKIRLRQSEIDDVVSELTSFITNIDFSAHFRSSHYSGEWSSFSLRSGSGREDDARNSEDGTYRNSKSLDGLHCTKAFLKRLEGVGSLRRVRLLKLARGTKVEKHIDLQEAPKRGVLRIHLPIITDLNYRMTILDHSISWPVGKLSVADFSVPHALENNGPDRTHLVIDLDGKSSVVDFLVGYKQRNITEEVSVFLQQLYTAFARNEVINFLIGWWRYGR